MQKRADILGLLLGWFAIIAQFILMIQNRQADIYHKKCRQEMDRHRLRDMRGRRNIPRLYGISS